MKRIISSVIVVVMFFLVGCANYDTLQSKCYGGMSFNELKRALHSEHLGYRLVSIYKGYSLVGVNKRGALPIYYIIDPNDKVVAMEAEGFDVGPDATSFGRQYLADFVDYTHRYKSDITIKSR